MTASFTLGPAWVDQYVSSLVLLHALLGQPGTAPSSRPASPESIIKTLQEIALDRYKPGDQSLQPGGQRAALIVEPPPLAPSETYLVIVLNASTDIGDFASVENGGIVFEDPAWAVLAAHSIAQVPRKDAPFAFDLPYPWRRLGVPLATDNADLWHRLGGIRQAVDDGKFSMRDFFGAVTGFLPPPPRPELKLTQQPEFRLMEVSSELLAALRAQGVQSFGRPIRFYELFQHPPVLHH
jgi:hypothetical protein